MSQEETSNVRKIQRLDGRAPRALGRGLSALFSDSGPSNTADGSGQNAHISDTNTREIAIDLIIRNPTQPRRRFDEANLQTLADSIASHGVLQPILVRPLDDGTQRYEIVAGERRWRAAQLAGLHQMPTLVRKFDDLNTLEVSIVENVQRADLNAIEEAQAYQQLMDRFGRTQQSIADSVGRSRAHIANTLRLLQLPDNVLEDVREGRLSAGHARAVLSSQNMPETARIIISKNLSVREAENLVSNDDSKKPKDVSRETSLEGDCKALANDLSAVLGLEIAINVKSTQSGSIAIHYTNLEQLDDICRRLTSFVKNQQEENA